MKRQNAPKIMFKAISFLTLVCFFFTQTGWALPGAGITVAPLRETPAFLQIEIPPDLASVEEVYEAPAKEDPKLILHIQNVHGNYESQVQIKKLLDYLYQKYGFKLLFAEGASEKLNADLLRFFPDAESNEGFADYMTKKGQLTGIEYYMMNGPEDVEAVGIEEANLYRANYDAFRKVYAAKPQVDLYLDTYEGRLQMLASRVFPQNTRRLLSEWRKFEEGHRDFLPYVKRLGVDAKSVLGIDLESLFSQVEWPQLTRLLALQSMEKEMDKLGAEKEKARLLEFLKTNEAAPELITAIEKLTEQRITMERLTAEKKLEDLPRYLLERLVTEMGPKGFRFHDYPSFSLWAGYLILQNELDSRQLFEEIEKIFTKILDEMSVNEREKNLLELYRDMVLTRKLLHLELNRKEWDRVLYRKDWLSFEALSNRLEKIAAGVEGAPLEGDAVSEGKGLTPILETSYGFYDLARKRESAFMQTIQTEMDSRKMEKAVLVTGGFHTDGLMEIFREKEINCGVLMPQLNGSVENAGYVESMLENTPSILDFKVQNIEMIARMLGAEAQSAQGRSLEDTIGVPVTYLLDFKKEPVTQESVEATAKLVAAMYKVQVVSVVKKDDGNYEITLQRGEMRAALKYWIPASIITLGIGIGLYQNQKGEAPAPVVPAVQPGDLVVLESLRDLEADINNRDAHESLFLAYQMSNRLEKAHDTYGDLIQRYPENALVYEYQGLIHLGLAAQQKNQQASAALYREAEGFFLKAISIDGQNDQLWQSLGDAVYGLGEWERLIEINETARLLAPENPVHHRNLAAAHARLGNVEAALPSYKKVTELDPENPEGWDHLGSAYTDLGNEQLANEAFQKAERLRAEKRNIGFSLLERRADNASGIPISFQFEDFDLPADERYSYKVELEEEDRQKLPNVFDPRKPNYPDLTYKISTSSTGTKWGNFTIAFNSKTGNWALDFNRVKDASAVKGLVPVIAGFIGSEIKTMRFLKAREISAPNFEPEVVYAYNFHPVTGMAERVEMYFPETKQRFQLVATRDGIETMDKVSTAESARYNINYEVYGEEHSGSLGIVTFETYLKITNGLVESATVDRVARPAEGGISPEVRKLLKSHFEMYSRFPRPERAEARKRETIVVQGYKLQFTKEDALFRHAAAEALDKIFTASKIAEKLAALNVPAGSVLTADVFELGNNISKIMLRYQDGEIVRAFDILIKEEEERFSVKFIPNGITKDSRRGQVDRDKLRNIPGGIERLFKEQTGAKFPSKVRVVVRRVAQRGDSEIIQFRPLDMEGKPLLDAAGKPVVLQIAFENETGDFVGVIPDAARSFSWPNLEGEPQVLRVGKVNAQTDKKFKRVYDAALGMLGKSVPDAAALAEIIAHQHVQINPDSNESEFLNGENYARSDGKGGLIQVTTKEVIQEWLEETLFGNLRLVRDWFVRGNPDIPLAEQGRVRDEHVSLFAEKLMDLVSPALFVDDMVEIRVDDDDYFPPVAAVPAVAETHGSESRIVRRDFLKLGTEATVAVVAAPLLVSEVPAAQLKPKNEAAKKLIIDLAAKNELNKPIPTKSVQAFKETDADDPIFTGKDRAWIENHMAWRGALYQIADDLALSIQDRNKILSQKELGEIAEEMQKFTPRELGVSPQVFKGRELRNRMKILDRDTIQRFLAEALIRLKFTGGDKREFLRMISFDELEQTKLFTTLQGGRVAGRPLSEIPDNDLANALQAEIGFMRQVSEVLFGLDKKAGVKPFEDGDYSAIIVQFARRGIPNLNKLPEQITRLDVLTYLNQLSTARNLAQNVAFELVRSLYEKFPATDRKTDISNLKGPAIARTERVLGDILTNKTPKQILALLPRDISPEELGKMNAADREAIEERQNTGRTFQDQLIQAATDKDFTAFVAVLESNGINANIFKAHIRTLNIKPETLLQSFADAQTEKGYRDVISGLQLQPIFSGEISWVQGEIEKVMAGQPSVPSQDIIATLVAAFLHENFRIVRGPSEFYDVAWKFQTKAPEMNILTGQRELPVFFGSQYQAERLITNHLDFFSTNKDLARQLQRDLPSLFTNVTTPAAQNRLVDARREVEVRIYQHTLDTDANVAKNKAIELAPRLLETIQTTFPRPEQRIVNVTAEGFSVTIPNDRIIVSEQGIGTQLRPTLALPALGSYLTRAVTRPEMRRILNEFDSRDFGTQIDITVRNPQIIRQRLNDLTQVITTILAVPQPKMVLPGAEAAGDQNLTSAYPVGIATTRRFFTVAAALGSALKLLSSDWVSMIAGGIWARPSRNKLIQMDRLLTPEAAARPEGAEFTNPDSPLASIPQLPASVLTVLDLQGLKSDDLFDNENGILPSIATMLRKGDKIIARLVIVDPNPEFAGRIKTFVSDMNKELGGGTRLDMKVATEGNVTSFVQAARRDLRLLSQVEGAKKMSESDFLEKTPYGELYVSNRPDSAQFRFNNWVSDMMRAGKGRGLGLQLDETTAPAEMVVGGVFLTIQRALGGNNQTIAEALKQSVADLFNPQMWFDRINPSALKGAIVNLLQAIANVRKTSTSA